eukprot:CAMPEP_0116136282 /NCGR_PEP_ID=MMETSP0329-20121206/11638_1 /TAXON_ID=697910 /ORGANISM="Pseudo-nitzschia arenysensis, Strain B593" /LENGTH=280 /DNA_ID=CAMNT_0003631133 /DNA_START=101 /DNA_END=940 /DNA_ORIENTATION=+
MSNFTSRCNFSVITVLIALAISHVMGFQQRFSNFQRLSSSCPASDCNEKTRGGCGTSAALFMGKLRNKQAELQRKMMLAKQQAAQKANENDDDSSTGGKQKLRMTDEELKEANDRKRFDELLNSQSASIGAQSSDNYLSQEQEEENIDAFRKGVDRFFEGDPAPSDPFEELVSIKSENAIGGPAAKRLLPWLRNTNKDDFLLIVSDPREKSPEFHNTLRDLSSELPRDIFSKIVFINADTPAQNRRLLKKNNISDANIRLFSDEKREWMQAYTALGENRW